MRNRVLSRGLVAAIILTAAPARAQTSTLTAACNGNSIAIAYSGRTPTPEYPFLGLWRQTLGQCDSWKALWFGEVTPEQNLLLDFTDTEVAVDSLYHYKLAPLPMLATPPPDLTQIYDAFAGCGSPRIARGVVRSRTWEFGQMLSTERCPGTCWPNLDIWTAQVDLAPYIDEEVELRGSIWWYWQWGWVMTVTAVEPLGCGVLPVNQNTWSGMKSLYR